jgi:lipoate-protein ligase A
VTGLRILDTGVRPARENLSLTEALAEGVRAGTSPATLRFQHFPPSAIIGRHQRLAREVDLDWVAANNVATARRMTGGGAIVMGPGILGWELIVPRQGLPAGLGDISRLICEAVAAALATFGIAAAYRPRNDVEVDGRKICGTGGYFDQDTLVFQGTVLARLDRELMLRALRVPAHKLERHGAAALFERVTDLATLLGEAPGMPAIQAAMGRHLAPALGRVAEDAALLPAEEARMRAIHETLIGADAFVEGRDDAFGAEGRTLRAEHHNAFGSIEAVIRLRDGAADVVDQVMLAGDFFAASPRVIFDLEAALRHRPLATLAQAAAAYLEQYDAGLLGMTAADVVAALDRASRQGEDA